MQVKLCPSSSFQTNIKTQRLSCCTENVSVNVKVDLDFDDEYYLPHLSSYTLKNIML